MASIDFLRSLTRTGLIPRAAAQSLLLAALAVGCGGDSSAPVASTPQGSQPAAAAKPAAPVARPQPPLTPRVRQLRTIATIPTRAKDPAAALKQLKPWLANGDRELREAAVLALWDIETEQATQLLAKAARTDSDPEIKSYAVEELVEREAPVATGTLMALLDDPDTDLREQVAEGLETLEDPVATKKLYEALETEQDEWVRDAIISALSTLDPSFDEDAYDE